MKEGWPVRTLSEVCQIRPPKSEARDALKDDDLVSFVPMNDLPIREKWLKTNSERPLGKVYGGYTYFSEGDVLMAKITPCFENGKLGIARGLKNGIGFGSSEFFVLRPDESVDPEFLFYFLCQDSVRDSGKRVMSGAVGHKRVPKEFIEQLPVPVPGFDDQKRIVAILDEAFAGIETAIANTEKNLANARELFESYLDSVFKTPDSDWEQKTFGDLYHVGSSKRVHKKDWKESGVPFYRAREIVKLAQHGAVENDLFISEDLFTEFSSKTGAPQAGDLMVTAVGTLGVCYVVQPSDRFYFKDASVLWFRPKQPVNEDFIKYAFRSPVVKRQTTDSQGATVGTLTISRANSICISVPSLEVQNEVASSLSTLEAEVLELQSVLEAKLASLKELKQSLLQKAFSGELTAERA